MKTSCCFRCGWVSFVCWISLATAGVAQEMSPTMLSLDKPDAAAEGIWIDAVGAGFLKGARSLDLKLSRGFGVNRGGPKVAHDLWLAHVEMGYMLHNAWNRDRWWGGNFELTGQLFGGLQDHPETAYFIGLNGGLRYHFATGGRLNPFVAGSIGVAATDIGLPDLGTVFQFDERVGAGLRYYVCPQQAITLEYFSLHVSNARIKRPNHGVNTHFVSLGYSWLF